MSPTILELYILALVDRGLQSKYDLQKRGGVSLGSSSPAINRMQAAKLIVQDVEGIDGKRPRHGLKLSTTGKRLVREGWRSHFGESAEADLDSIMRLVDMANHYGAKPVEIGDFLRAMASKRVATSKSALSAREIQTDASAIVSLQRRWGSARLLAEARFLLKLADSDFSGKPNRNTKIPAAKMSRTLR